MTTGLGWPPMIVQLHIAYELGISTMRSPGFRVPERVLDSVASAGSQ